MIKEYLSHKRPTQNQDQRLNLIKLKYLCYAIAFIDWISFGLGVPVYLFQRTEEIKTLNQVGFILSNFHTILIAFIFHQIPQVLLTKSRVVVGVGLKERPHVTVVQEGKVQEEGIFSTTANQYDDHEPINSPRSG